MKFSMINQGTCTRLKLFGEDIRKLLINNQWREVDSKQADFIFINSCSFLKSKEDYFVKLIHENNNLKNKNQKIVVFGCLPSTNPARIRNINRDCILFSRKIEEVISFFNLNTTKINLSTVIDSELNFFQRIIALFNRFILKDITVDFRLMKKNVFHIKISEGCLGKCSYCSERFTTLFKSRSVAEITNSFSEGLAKGFKLFALNSDDSSSFGRDNDESITKLLNKLVSLPGNFKIAISEFNPQGLFDKSIIGVLSSEKISYITLPIQSGSQKILNKMRRPYKIVEVLK